MKIILTEKNLNGYSFPEDVSVKTVGINDLKSFDCNTDVYAIVGSRAMSRICADLDLPSLKLFQLTSAGFDGVPCDEFTKKGVAVANAGTVYSVPIAETVVFGMLTVAKKLRNNPNNRHFKFTRHYSTISELYGKNVLIMGAGNIGTAVADRLLGFDMTINGYDPYCPQKSQYRHIIRTRDELKSKVSEYDYIVSTLPDNEQTKGFINQELLDAMKSTAVIINVGRKSVLNEEDLYKALKSKTIGGAVLDMFEKIPNPITNKFRRLRNTVVLPGVSAISREVNVRLREHVYKNLVAVLEGKEISNRINEGK